jgi:hypothetical protein
MSTQVKELDSGAILEALRQRGRMPVRELAAAVGEPSSEAMFMSLAALSDLLVVGDEVVRKLTPEDRKDYRELEKKFGGGQRESTAALREIRERKLWREDYTTFDAYMAGRWYRTRQWATQQLNWLRCMELLEESGKNSYRLNVDDAQTLGALEDDPELYVQALEEAEEEARRTGKKRTTKLLQAAVKRLVDYKALRSHLGMPDLAYNESRALARLGSDRQLNPNLVEEAKVQAEAESRPLSDCLLQVCQSRHTIPTDQQLLSVARGKDLDAFLQPLLAAKAHWDEVAELQKKRRKLEDEMGKIAAQIAPSEPAQPQGKGAQWLTPSTSVATTVGAEEEGTYRVRLTGDFVNLAENPEFSIHGDELAWLLESFAQYIHDGAEISVESSITFVPPAMREEDEDAGEEEDEPEEQVEDEDEVDDE